MYRMMLVDDEAPSLRSCKRMIEQSGLPYTVAYEAVNGLEAFEQIPHVKPDIVITDIKMPIMDGVELVKKINSAYPHIYTIIVSGYMEFEYSREALRNNVTDYFLKPLDPDQITAVLETLHSKLDESYYLKGLKYLENLLLKHVDEHEFAEYVHFPYYTISVLRVGALPNRFNHMISSEAFAFFHSVETALDGQQRDSGEEKRWLLNGRDGNEMMIVIGSPSNPAEHTSRILQQIWAAIGERSSYFTIVYSPVFTSLTDLSAMTAKLFTLLKRHLTLNKSQLIAADNPPEGFTTSLPDLSEMMERKLTALMEGGLQERLKIEIAALFQDWEEKSLPQYAVEMMLKQLIDLTRRVLWKKDRIDLDIEDQVDEAITLAPDFRALRDAICLIVDELLHDFSSATNKYDTERLIRDIDQYLHHNISKPVSLQGICNLFQVSQSYVSRIFREAKELTFNEYFTHLRIQEAKKLIVQYPDMKLLQVAELVGYEDQHYFSKVFKNIYGASPSDFKRNVNHPDQGPC